MSDPLSTLRSALAGTYDVERALGSGGMGNVFLARDRTLERPVAIKIIAPELAASRMVHERFLAEARTIARLRHPSIVDIYTTGEADGLLYFVMEYVPGESLRELLDRERRLPPARVARILRELADALAYAHAQGIVHRDIKPENILIDRDSGRAMLTDFGVAQALSASAGAGAGDQRLTGMGFVIGSPRYMSPEQAAGERALDGRSDIYSLGLVGYEMLAGEPAFVAPSAASLIAKQIVEPAPSVAVRAQDAPPALAAAVDRALRKDPAERWQSGAEMAAALDDLAISGERSGPGLAAPRGQRRRWLYAAGLAAALVLVPLGYYVARGADAEGPPPASARKSILVLPFENQSGSRSLDWLREGSVNMLTLNLAAWRDLKVVDYDRVLDLLRDARIGDDTGIGLEEARRLARKAGVWTVVTGQMIGGRDSITVIARAYDVATGRRLDEVEVDAAMSDDPRAIFDRVSHHLLGLAGAPPMSPELAKSTTQSVEAYRAYLTGVRALNNWDFDVADSALAHAIRADSTFALAYYKRALLSGWRRDIGDSTDLVLARLAARHGTRLPPRERALVDAYVSLAEGLDAGMRGDSTVARQRFAAAQRQYGALVTRDSTDAEAWYGLGDAYFHTPASRASEEARNFTRSMRAFDRTLVLDSTFHLAYSHKLHINNMAATQGSPLVMRGDSVVGFDDPAQLEAYGRDRVRAARVVARQRAVENARHWVASDPDATPAYQALADAYVAAGEPEAAATTLREAVQRHSLRAPEIPYRIAGLELQAGRPADALATLQRAMRTHGLDSLSAPGRMQRFPALVSAASAAAYAGDIADMNAVLRMAEELVPRIPVPSGKTVSTDGFVRTWAALNMMAMGIDPPAARRDIDAALRLLEPVPEMASARQIVALYAYVLARDTSYLAPLRAAGGTATLELPAFQALRALEQGDSARATRLAAGFTRGDSTRAPVMPGGLLAPFVEAEVLAAIGDARGALGSYDAIDPRRFTSLMGVPDPRWPLYARSFLARARLHEQLGDRARAEADYTRFMESWRNADPRLQPQLRAAREALARLRDRPVSANP